MSDFVPLTRHYDARGIQHIILHGTEVDWAKTEAILRGQTEYEASCHYAISQHGELVQYVSNDVRAWHAGVSYWAGIKKLNNSSIGFELECVSNSAKFDGVESTYSAAQIDVLVPLVKKLMEHYAVDAWNVIGHQDIAPNRKWDPGMRFPWQDLAKHGIGIWHDLPPDADDNIVTDAQRVAIFKRDLTFYGYTNDPAVAAENHVNVIKAFQTHFLPWHICGQVTEQSIAALNVLLNKKYGAF